MWSHEDLYFYHYEIHNHSNCWCLCCCCCCCLCCCCCCFLLISIIFVAMNKVYGCVIGRRHHLVRKDSSGYDLKEYREHPERYASTFSRTVSFIWNYGTCMYYLLILGTNYATVRGKLDYDVFVNTRWQNKKGLKVTFKTFYWKGWLMNMK